MSLYFSRFAPSPTGFLHLGHAFAALVAYDEALSIGGRACLRIEDIDGTRSRAEYVGALYEDLEWLGLDFGDEVWVQSARVAVYELALARLKALGVLYPCFCTRREVAQEWERAMTAPQEGDGVWVRGAGELAHYAGRCRHLSEEERDERIRAGQPHNWRLDAGCAQALTGSLIWRDRVHGEFTCYPERLGDVILARKDAPTSYHLAVTVDDAAQGISLVTRGEDLLSVTGLHRTLQALLDLPVPEWMHHPLVRDDAGKRLAKRDAATALRELRAKGWRGEDVLSFLREHTGWSWKSERFRPN